MKLKPHSLQFLPGDMVCYSCPLCTISQHQQISEMCLPFSELQAADTLRSSQFRPWPPPLLSIQSLEQGREADSGQSVHSGWMLYFISSTVRLAQSQVSGLWVSFDSNSHILSCCLKRIIGNWGGGISGNSQSTQLVNRMWTWDGADGEGWCQEPQPNPAVLGLNTGQIPPKPSLPSDLLEVTVNCPDLLLSKMNS